jgi:hypothetical protein
MKAPLRKTFSLAASAIIAALALGSAFGQAVKVTGEKPEFDEIPSPQFAGVKNKSFKPLNWLEVEARLAVDMAPMPASKTLDKLTVKWYVAVANPDKKGTYLLLTKDISHVNVPIGSQGEIYASVYISPASLRRITGSDNGGKSAIDLVGYEVLVDGVKKAEGSNKLQPGWWNSPSEKISRSEAIPLLDKSQTPFASMWWDRYPEISTERR